MNRWALILVLFFALASACQTTTNSGGGDANRSAANTATPASANAGQPEAAKKEDATASSSGSSLATPTETYKAGYTARQNKDIEGLKRVLSKAALQFLTDIGKEQQKTLDDQLKALADRPQAPTAESRNEKINGDRATIEYLSEKGNWATMDFVKEGNDWKIDLPQAQR